MNRLSFVICSVALSLCPACVGELVFVCSQVFTDDAVNNARHCFSYSLIKECFGRKAFSWGLDFRTCLLMEFDNLPENGKP